MKKTFFFTPLLITAFSLTAYSQSAQYDIKGVVLDSASHDPLPLATVYVKNVKDSTLITYALTDDKGVFLLKGVPSDRPVRMTVFYTGYRPWSRHLRGEKKDTLDMGAIYISMRSNELGAVTITGEQPPIAIRGDTIEFNASSYKMRPNSALADLLKKLPGIEVDKDGTITANGKKVDRIKVDGKSFFGNDPKIALQNLPSAIIDKVQVTDTKTREEEIAGEPASGDTKTINVTLQKGKDHGFFGRAYAGYGTGEHYAASALLNYFEGKRRISLLGATNNINEVGFSMNEIIDMIGGNQNIHYLSINSSTGSFGVNGLNFGGGGEGIKKSTSAGVNYNDDFGKHFSVNGSYFYGNVSVDNETRRERQNILPDSVFYYNSDNLTHNDNLNHRITATVSYKDSLWHIYYEPYIGVSDKKGTSRNDAVSTGVKGQTINESNSVYTNDDHATQFRNRLNIFRTFKKKGQYLSLYLNAENRTSDGRDYNNYRNIFYDGSADSDSANQYIDNQATENQYYGRLTYKQPFTENLSLNIGYGINWQYGLTDKKTFDFSKYSGKYSEQDTAYSNKFRSNIITQSPQLGLTFTSDSGKWRLDAGMEFNFIGLHHYSYTHDAAFDQQQFFMSPTVNLSRQITKRGHLRLVYNSYVRQPEISQLLPVADNTNPLYITKGNPDLKPAVYRNISLGYNSFDFKSGNNIWFSIRYNDTKNNIASVTTYDDQLRQLTTYTNVNGDKGIHMNLALSKTKKKENNHWQVKFGSSFGISKNHAFVNSVPYVSRRYSASPRVSFTYGYKELYEITPSYRFDYQYNRYDIDALDNRQNTMQEAGLSATLYWPSRITWASDWNYTYNSNVAPGFRKGFWLWNASVGLDVFKNRQGTVKLSVYDLLDQNVSVRRNITDTYIEDRQTVILHRYFMLKFIYNLRKFGEKKKKENNMPFFFF